MMHLDLRGELGLIAALANDVRAVGGGSDDHCLILIGASNLTEATSQVQSLTAAERRRTVVVGLEDRFESHPFPEPGTYGAFLEEFELLGAMPPWLTEKWLDSGFIGKKESATNLGFWYGISSQTPTYAVWGGLGKFTSAASFLVHLIASEGGA